MPGDALGTEFQVNSYFAGNQSTASVAMDADGDFVVAWQSADQDGSNYGVFAQRYDAAGVAQGAELQVNSFIDGGQYDPSVAIDLDGDFVVAWTSSGQDGSSLGIFARRFDAAGVAQGPDFQVNTFAAGIQREPAVAMAADGDFVVAWQSADQDGSSYGVYAQRYDAAGVPQGTEFRVNTSTLNIQRTPAVAMAADGDFVVAWWGAGLGDTSGVFAQRYDAAGVAQGAEFLVNTHTTDSQRAPAVAMDAEGDFVVAWEGVGPSGYGIFARRYDAAGVAKGAQIQVNSIGGSSPESAVVAMAADGDFVVAWSGWGPGDMDGVFARRYDAGGVAQGTDFQVNTYTANIQRLPAVALDADGDFALAWQSSLQDGAGNGIFAQRYEGVARVAGDFDGDGNADLLWHNTATGAAVVWLMDGETKIASQTIGKPPVAWRVAGVGEFNGDGKADILWHNSATGAAVVWQMDGFTKTGAVSIGTPPPAWVIEKVEDTDGDGLSDIFWRNSATGNTLVWRMLGYTRLATSGTGNVPAEWEAQ